MRSRVAMSSCSNLRSAGCDLSQSFLKIQRLNPDSLTLTKWKSIAPFSHVMVMYCQP